MVFTHRFYKPWYLKCNRRHDSRWKILKNYKYRTSSWSKLSFSHNVVSRILSIQQIFGSFLLFFCNISLAHGCILWIIFIMFFLQYFSYAFSPILNYFYNVLAEIFLSRIMTYPFVSHEVSFWITLTLMHQKSWELCS